MENKVVSPILIGAKSIGQYGGYESFIYKLLEYHREQKNIHYYVYCNELEKKLHFKQDSRIKFVGTVYDEKLLKKIREKAYGRGLCGAPCGQKFNCFEFVICILPNFYK